MKKLIIIFLTLFGLQQVLAQEHAEKKISSLIKELSGGKLNPETGEVVWHLHLAPGKKKELILHYAVKLPKYDDMVIE